MDNRKASERLYSTLCRFLPFCFSFFRATIYALPFMLRFTRFLDPALYNVTEITANTIKEKYVAHDEVVSSAAVERCVTSQKNGCGRD